MNSIMPAVNLIDGIAKMIRCYILGISADQDPERLPSDTLHYEMVL